MDQAVSAVLKDGMSVNKASKIFNVPRKILTERVGGRVSRSRVSKMYNVPCKLLTERESGGKGKSIKSLQNVQRPS